MTLCACEIIARADPCHRSTLLPFISHNSRPVQPAINEIIFNDHGGTYEIDSKERPFIFLNDFEGNKLLPHYYSRMTIIDIPEIQN